MEVAVTTDVGTGQRQNDDAWCHEQLHRNVTLLAVADGFGRPHGVASAAIVLEATREVIRRELRRATFPSRPLTPADVRELLTTAFAAGNDRLLQVGGGTMDHVAAGSTCTLVLIVSNQAFVAHVGDTRAYLLRRGELVQLTSDDAISPEPVRSASGLPQLSRVRFVPTLLTKVLGVEPSAAVVPKIAHYTLHPHDSVVLCTDGVTRGLGTGDLTGALSAREAVKGAADRLVVLARGSGSVDNATVLLARNATVHGPSAEASSLTLAAPWRWAAALVVALSIFLGAGLGVRAFWFGDTHLYLAMDSAGDVGLFAGSQGSLMGLPLHVERAVYHVAVSDLSAADQRRLADGMPVADTSAAQSVVDRWQAQSKR